MGNYNPHTPRILGQEWVPIREEDLVYAPKVNSIERGTSYVQAASQRVRDARFYIHQPPESGVITSQVAQINIYPYSSAGETGPIREVIIPVNSVSTTGSNITVVGTTSHVQALQMPGDNKYISFAYNSGTAQQMAMFFAVNSYPILYNKRILNVSLLYSGGLQDQGDTGSSSVPISFEYPPNFIGSQYITVLSQSNDGGTEVQFSGSTYLQGAGSLEGLNTVIGPITSSSLGLAEVHALNLGDINNGWDATNIGGVEKLPWRYADLQRFEASAGTSRQFLKLNVGIPLTTNGFPAGSGTDATLLLQYMALRVLYCEETRVLYGGQMMRYGEGTNVITLRDRTHTADPVLPAGTYLPTLTWVYMGDVGFGSNASDSFPEINAVRQLYEIPSHPATNLLIPFPPEDHIGETFTREETMILPQVSIHTSGGTLTEPHVYGRQAVAQVWGGITATQEIHDSLAGGATTWPWVRYYARRFGDTSVSLTLTGAGQNVAITPTEFDELDEIIDGWKEVTLRFTTPPTMGGGTIPQFVWSATNETAGNRWEILGAAAPALSGIPGNALNQIASTNHRLGVATYGQPVSGASINLGWIPGISPLVTATTDDSFSDATIIFAQDMPTVTGFAVVTATQALTGIGQDCGVDPCGIPTDIIYNQITWSATSSSIPASGFGYYELQRMDTVETEWATIMQASSPTGASFKDYEARPGILTSYRIRAVDVLLFPGQWSSTVTVTIPSPGVSGSCLEDAHVLIFTSNERQDGSINLAYSSAWEGQVEENFTFPEAGFVQLQLMYNKDFYTAFRPLERGGERFTRTVLVQAAAISPETLADFTGLRDMAWDTVNYICVRDEDGNRWFATVLVPGGRVLRDRRLYMAPVEIIEVTATPTPVDPYA